VTYYADRRAVGLCASCPRVSEIRSLCGWCMRKLTRVQAQNRAVLQRARLCTLCGATPRPGFKRCEGCAKDQREAQAESRARRSA